MNGADFGHSEPREDIHGKGIRVETGIGRALGISLEFLLAYAFMGIVLEGSIVHRKWDGATTYCQSPCVNGDGPICGGGRLGSAPDDVASLGFHGSRQHSGFGRISVWVRRVFPGLAPGQTA